jgi:hypothetical protein
MKRKNSNITVPPAPTLTEKERGDLQTYLTECIVALRWLKDRQLTFTISIMAFQVALYNDDIVLALGRLHILGLPPVKVKHVSVAVFFIFCMLVISTWCSTRQTRKREELLLSALSPRLLHIISITTWSKKYGNHDWLILADIIYYAAHILPPMGMTCLHIAGLEVATGGICT